MNRKEIFLGAHAITRGHMEKNPKDNYREVFSRALRFLYTKMKEKQQTESNKAIQEVKTETEQAVKQDNVPVDNKIHQAVLPYKTVTINGFSREVAMKIDGDQILGRIANRYAEGKVSTMLFVWDTKTHALPSVKVNEGVDKVKAASYARLFILERLKIDNISINLKSSTKNVEYINIPKEDEVWCNIFENGYIRGVVNGHAFTWNIFRYDVAAVVTIPGFEGKITDKICTQAILNRLSKAGYKNIDMVRDEVKKLAVLSLAKKHIKSIVITKTDDLTVVAYEDGSIASKINGKYCVWNNTKNSINDLDDKVKAAIKTVAATPKLLIEYIKKNGEIATTASSLENQDVSSATA